MMKISRIVTLSWIERLVEKFGGGREGARCAAGASKHGRGWCPPRDWRAIKRKKHKRQKQARRAQRGKR